MTFSVTMVKRINQETTNIRSQGFGLSWGISPRVGGGHHSLA